ncbi:MAG: alanine dehydrogenase [Alphaproteobacteria bacterium]|nr:alanine dehydrogenase [Alphaproteobacteria bacterium]
MRIGVPKEIKTHEYRVGLTDVSVRELTSRGHSVMVQAGAGLGAGILDSDYAKVGASVVDDPAQIFATADMIVKVKEPQPEEYGFLRADQILFTYLHLAPDPHQTEALLKAGCVGIAYETVTDRQGRLPLLSPMSEVAGRMAVQAGAHYLEKIYGGRGVLLGGVPGVDSGKIVILGGGVVGTNAAMVAAGMGADVTVLDKSPARLAELDYRWAGRVHTLYATAHTIESQVVEADLLIGAVLIPGAATPKLVRQAMLAKMKRGAVIVDVAIDQGGCIEGSRPTTHTHPIFEKDGVIFYCVANMPGAVSRTSTFALNNATLPYVLALADKGWQKALRDDVGFRQGLNVVRGKIVYAPVATALGLPSYDADPFFEDGSF